jgi:hypothetical protein
LDKAFFGRRLLRIAWLSVLRVGAEEWKVLLLAAVNAVDDVEHHGWNTGNTARETRRVRDIAGRVKTVRSENIAAQYWCSNSEN